MSNWWLDLSGLTKFFYFFAIPSTVILVLQSIMTFVGFGLSTDGDMDMGDDIDMDGDLDLEGDPSLMDSPDGMDLDGDGNLDFENLSGLSDFRFVTFRGIIAFMTLFGWMGASLSTTELPIFVIMLLAILAGLFGMFVIALLFYGISKLQSNGNLQYRLAIGKEARVYIPIPANRSGNGKVQLMLQERLVEVLAVTEESSLIPTGEMVRIIDMLDATTFVVERL